MLRSNADKPQQVVLQRVRERFPDVDEAAVVRSLELTTRLWLTINVHSESVAVGPVQADIGTIEWPSELSLKDLVQSQFQSSHTNEWSNEKYSIPQTILQEAIDTLNFLFPFGHGPTRELLRREKKMSLYRLGFCDRARMLALADYDVWQARVANLVEVFNEPPRDLRQLLSDRRNVMEWATFLIGMLVLILTLVSIAFGTVSTVYAIKQYELALAQACVAEGAAELLSRFCG